MSRFGELQARVYENRFCIIGGVHDDFGRERVYEMVGHPYHCPCLCGPFPALQNLANAARLRRYWTCIVGSDGLFCPWRRGPRRRDDSFLKRSGSSTDD